MLSARIRHLNEAPIKEALIDFRVDLPSGVNIEAINAIVEVARSAYPIVEPLQTFGAIFDLQEAKVTKVEEDRGFILWDEKRVQAVQFRLDGFTFNRLKPYESWDALHSEAMKWWEIYHEALKPEALKRTAVKYTNRLLFPDSDFQII